MSLDVLAARNNKQSDQHTQLPEGAVYLFNIESLDSCQLLVNLSLKHQLIHMSVLKA